MIDSVDLRIHDLVRHKDLVNIIKGYNRGVSKFRYELSEESPFLVVDSSTGENIPLKNGSFTDSAYSDFFENIEGMKKINKIDKTKLVEETQVIEKDNYKEFIHFWDRKKRIEIFSSVKKRVKSSYYDLAIWFDSEKDYIQMSFSVPKYLYGHNISQFVPHPNYNNRINTTELESFDIQKTLTFDRLMSFFELFFKKEFNCVPIECYKSDSTNTIALDYSYIELTRIDFCYNMIFKDEQLKSGVMSGKDRALNYFSELRRIKKKYDRNGSGGYGNTIYFMSDLYSFKIYHKGTEFRVNDRKRLESINRESKSKHHNVDKLGNSKDVFDIETLQIEADKILRYEIYFHRKFMSHIFKNYLCRKKEYSSDFKSLLIKVKPNIDYLAIKNQDNFDNSIILLYEKCKRTDKKYFAETEKLSKKYAPINEKNYTSFEVDKLEIFKLFDSKINLKGFEFHNLAHKWTPSQLNAVKKMKSFKYKRTYFMLQTTKKVYNYYYHSNSYVNEPTKVLGLKTKSISNLSTDLFICMADTFKDFINQFVLNSNVKINDVKKDLFAKQELLRGKKLMYAQNINFSQIELPKGFSASKMLPILKFLEMGLSLDEIKVLNVFTKATFYRYRKILKEYGISESTNFKKEIEINKIDFRSYYQGYSLLNSSISNKSENFYKINV